MLYMICPTCGELLGNKQIPFQTDLIKLCEEYGVDHDIMSRGIIVKDKGFNEKKKAIVDRYTGKDNICCRARLVSFSPLVEIVSPAQ